MAVSVGWNWTDLNKNPANIHQSLKTSFGFLGCVCLFVWTGGQLMVDLVWVGGLDSVDRIEMVHF